MSSKAFSNTNQQAGLWPWLIGGATFLITTLYPPLTLFTTPGKFPGWLGILGVYNLNGGIGWQLLQYTRENAGASYPAGALLGMILPFCTVPLVLTMSTVLTWRRMMKRTPYPTPQRGLLTIVQATALSLLAICLLALLVFGIAALLSSGHSAAMLAMIIFAVTALAQSLWVLPALLIAGGIIAMLQARSRTY